jgi:peptide/nickel transport system ATP-binding protein
MSEQPLIELDGVSVVHKVRSGRVLGHDDVHALTAVDLAVREGETLGIVGESGCGKTTLAKVIVGMQAPTSGEVRFRGRSLWGLGRAERARDFGSTVAMVFQDPVTALNRRLPLETIIADPLVVHHVGNPATRRARVRELMTLVGLPASTADSLPSQLSGGQRQRVAIARALALEPALIVADEPTSALDVSVRAQILNLLIGLRERLGLAIVFVSHDIQTVRKISDRVVTMYLGRVAESAPAARLPGTAHHPYTRALFSATPSLLHRAEPIPLAGPIPSATRPPSGCNFHTRCWKATDECAARLPDLAADAGCDSHTYRCIHPEAVV